MDIKSIKEITLDYITEIIIKNTLENGIIIDLNDIRKDIIKYKNISIPIDITKYTDKILNAELDAYGNLIMGLRHNFNILNKYSTYLKNAIFVNYILMSNKINMLTKKIDKINGTINKLMMTNKYITNANISLNELNIGTNTYEIIEENFKTHDMINYEKSSNIKYDSNSQSVSLSKNNIVEIPTNNISFNISTLDTANYITSGIISNNNEITASEDITYQIVKSRSEITSCVLFLDLSAIDKDISILKLNTKMSTDTCATVLGSVDNIYYTNLGEYSVSNILEIPVMNNKYIKIQFKKNYSDYYNNNGNYYYYFTFSNLKLYQSSYNTTGVLITNAYIPDNTWDYLALNTKEKTDNTTTILYYISTDGISWSPIEPLNKSTKNNVISRNATIVKTEICKIDENTASKFNVLMPSHYLLTDFDQNIIPKSISVYSNINDMNEYNIVIDDIYKGWKKLNNGYVETNYITYIQNTKINLDIHKDKYPELKIYIDGKEYNNDFVLPTGKHTIKCLKEYHNLIHEQLVVDFIYEEELIKVPYTTFLTTDKTNVFSIIELKENGNIINKIIVKKENTYDNIYIVKGNVIVMENANIYLKAIMQGTQNITPILYGFNFVLSNQEMNNE